VCVMVCRRSRLGHDSLKVVQAVEMKFFVNDT
jgi:hypothetical protein